MVLVWLCVRVLVWLCVCVLVWLCVCVLVWLCVCVLVWLCVCVLVCCAFRKPSWEIVPELDVPSVVAVLTRQLLHDSTPTRMTALRWINHLFTKRPTKVTQPSVLGEP